MTVLRLVRILRGTALTALTWSVVWAVGGALLRVFGILPSEVDFLSAQMVVHAALDFAQSGAIAGTVFAVALAATDRHRVLRLSTPGTARWGAAAAVVLPLCGLILPGGLEFTLRHAGYVASSLAEWAILGGFCAAGSLALARRTLPGEATPGGVPLDEIDVGRLHPN